MRVSDIKVQVALPAFVLSLSQVTPGFAEQPSHSSWHYQVTEQASLIYNGDNRDERSGDVRTYTNDNFGLFNNRIDTQASRNGLVLSLRLDGLYFYARPNPVSVGLDMVEARNNEQSPAPVSPSDADFFRLKTFEAGTDLSNRYINWLVPAKYSASYTWDLGPQGKDRVQAQVGDFYAQLGRGLVLSVRKQDALASDTTIRGGRLSSNLQLDKTRIETTVLAGTGNPLRVDETSGRYLGVLHRDLQGLDVITEAGMPRAIDTDYAPRTRACNSSATCSYAPDDLFGAQLLIAAPLFKLGSQASLLRRDTILSNDIVRSARQILTASQSLELPALGDFGSIYFEGAGQQRRYWTESASLADDQAGYALYGAVDVFLGPLQLSAEGKHYRAFYPLLAGISTVRAPQFNQIQYSQAPTTEPVWNTAQFENFNTCTSGGRTRADLHLHKQASVYAWVGRWNSWAESVANENCTISQANLNRVWDFAIGSDIASRDRRSKGDISVGVRDDTTARQLGAAPNTTQVFYREAYSRYDVLLHLRGRYSMQLQGWHRYRHQSIGGPGEPWAAGQHLTALEVAPFGNLAFGVEYDSNPLTPAVYFNGQVTYRINSASNVALFVGQRRGAQRCVAGVCRVFPPFEGARLDVTWRL